jgi:chromosome segregation ATPase
MLCLTLLALLAALGGCKKAEQPASSSGAAVSETTPIAELKAAAESMDVEKLKSMAMQYKSAIEAKTKQLEEMTAKLKEIPLTEQVGEEAKAIQAELDQLNKSVSALKERFQVYYDMLKEKGADVASLTL